MNNKKNPLIYLDWAATAPPHPELTAIMSQTAVDYYGNPSSPHKQGLKAEELLDKSRNILAAVLNCMDKEIIFTSGATEANNMVILSLIADTLVLKKNKQKNKIIISGIEHSSVWQPVQFLKNCGFTVDVLHTDISGFIDPGQLESKLDNNTVLVAIMLVNNETGAIQPIAECVRVVRQFQYETGRRIIFHTDAVQALNKIPFMPAQLGVDTASISAHKTGGPRGIGALYIKRGLELNFLYRGGNQEEGTRPGTENLPAIHAFALIAQKMNKNIKTNYDHAQKLVKNLLAGIQDFTQTRIIPGSRKDWQDIRFSPYILNIAFIPLLGEVLVRALDMEGICVSTGAACNSKAKNRTRVLNNMGIVKNTALSAIRISTGYRTSMDDIDKLISALKKQLPYLKKASG